MLGNVLGNVFSCVLGHRLNMYVNDSMRKTKTLCNACICYDVLGLFVEEVYLPLCTKISFVLLPTNDMATVVDNWGHAVT